MDWIVSHNFVKGRIENYFTKHFIRVCIFLTLHSELKKKQQRGRTRAKTDPRFVEKKYCSLGGMVGFDTLTTTFNHQISKLVIGVKNHIYKRRWQIWGKSGWADKHCWRGPQVFFIQVPASASELIIPAFLIQTTHDWLGWTTFSNRTKKKGSSVKVNKYVLTQYYS